jgi:hypothetical protein
MGNSDTPGGFILAEGDGAIVVPSYPVTDVLQLSERLTE